MSAEGVWMIDTTDPISFGPGTYVGDAAEALAELVNRMGDPLEAEFNGTPMNAFPGDLPRHVHERWACEVELAKLRRKGR